MQKNEPIQTNEASNSQRCEQCCCNAATMRPPPLRRRACPRLAHASAAKTSSKAKPPPKAIDVLPPLLVASAITATATYPLDFLRAARMSSAASADAAKLGLRAAVAKFSQGLAPEVAKGTLSRVLKFGGFPVAHRLLYDRAPAAGSAASRAAAGALATFPEMALCTPLETGKLALQLDALKAAPAFDNQLQKAAAALTAAAGPAALYAGYCALQCRQAVWTAVYFASRPAFAEAFGALPGATFFSGLGAGVLGAVANCPFDVCRSVAQKELIGAWVSGGEAVTRAPGLAHALWRPDDPSCPRAARGASGRASASSRSTSAAAARSWPCSSHVCERAWAKARA